MDKNVTPPLLPGVIQKKKKASEPEMAVGEMTLGVRNSGHVSACWSKCGPETQSPDPWWICPCGTCCGKPQLWLSVCGHRFGFVKLEAVKEKPVKF